MHDDERPRGRLAPDRHEASTIPERHGGRTPGEGPEPSTLPDPRTDEDRDGRGPPGDDPLAGDPKYAVVRRLGAGGMGQVYEALHRALGATVVVKLLHEHLADNPRSVDRMRLEAQALARLRHPNLVAVTDFGVAPGGAPYFVMERLVGVSLADELRAHGPLAAREAIGIVRQALAGLGVAHEAGLVHRDVKPANIFLCRTAAPALPRAEAPRVKLLDFGVAKVIHAASDAPAPLALPTRKGVLVGTPRYASPEQVLGGRVDARADLYSMGLVLYACLCGRGPFDDCPSAVDMLQAHATRTPEPPSRHAAPSHGPLPAGLEAVVMRCLAKRPEDRFATAAELDAALGRVLADADRRAAAPAPCDRPADALPPQVDTEDMVTERRAPRAPHGAAPAPAPVPHGEALDLPTKALPASGTIRLPELLPLPPRALPTVLCEPLAPIAIAPRRALEPRPTVDPAAPRRAPWPAPVPTPPPAPPRGRPLDARVVVGLLFAMLVGAALAFALLRLAG
ncbi:MAG: serine/threonine protein kinase [Polyangiaceae bacterium]|nr:serine/threonine protein kinase [Polyangiaceae bacterium]